MPVSAPVAAQSVVRMRAAPGGFFGATTQPVPARSGEGSRKRCCCVGRLRDGSARTNHSGDSAQRTDRHLVGQWNAGNSCFSIPAPKRQSSPPASPSVSAPSGPRSSLIASCAGSGSLQTSEVELHSFAIGGVAIPWRRVRVAPINVASVFSGPLDGVLGADSLNSFDIDLDLPNNRITLYSRQTCPGAAPAWTEPLRHDGRRPIEG